MNSFLSYFQNLISESKLPFGHYSLFAFNTAGDNVGGPIHIASNDFKTPMFDVLENPGDGSWVNLSGLKGRMLATYADGAWALTEYCLTP